VRKKCKWWLMRKWSVKKVSNNVKTRRKCCVVFPGNPSAVRGFQLWRYIGISAKCYIMLLTNFTWTTDNIQVSLYVTDAGFTWYNWHLKYQWYLCPVYAGCPSECFDARIESQCHTCSVNSKFCVQCKYMGASMFYGHVSSYISLTVIGFCHFAICGYH